MLTVRLNSLEKKRKRIRRRRKKNANNTIRWKNIKQVLIVFSFYLLLVCCTVGCEALPVDDTTTVFYVFGSEAIYIVDPEDKTVLSTIGADGVCTPAW